MGGIENVSTNTIAGTLVLDGHTLTIDNVIDVARNDLIPLITICNEAQGRMHYSDQLKSRTIETKQPIYGVTTGFGDSCIRQISPDKVRQLQASLIRYHLNGVGPLASDDTVRATILIRANCLARGFSGVRPILVETLLGLLTHDILPMIPERGSVGASGDLVPLSYIASALMGEGKVKYKGEILNATDALNKFNIEPITLEAKEGLGLINGTSFMSAFASLAVFDAKELTFVAELGTALASEALLGNKGHFHSFIHVNKPHPGQVASASNIWDLLDKSELSRDYHQILNSNEHIGDRSYLQLGTPIQDRYSIRCAPNVIGVLRDTISWSSEWVKTEINSSNDNPLFDVDSVHNGGNFYGGHIAQAMDSLKIAVANIADLMDRQMELVVDEKFNNGLPPNLVMPKLNEEDDGLDHGFKGMQIACSALTAEALKLANPASVFSRSTEAHNQDKVSMGTIAARDARTIIDLTQHVCAIHLLAICQAIDLRSQEKMSPLTRKVHSLIRSFVPTVAEDRRMDDDIDVVIKLIRTGQLRAALS